MDQVQWVTSDDRDQTHLQMDVIDVFPDQAKRSAKHWLDQWKFLAQRESIMLLGMSFTSHAIACEPNMHFAVSTTSPILGYMS